MPRKCSNCGQTGHNKRTCTVDFSLSNAIKLSILVQEECPICYEKGCDFETKCKHTFHIECIQKWYSKKRQCPMCRTKIKKPRK